VTGGSGGHGLATFRRRTLDQRARASRRTRPLVLGSPCGGGTS
jgi:hypothetical protein